MFWKLRKFSKGENWCTLWTRTETGSRCLIVQVFFFPQTYFTLCKSSVIKMKTFNLMSTCVLTQKSLFRITRAGRVRRQTSPFHVTHLAVMMSMRPAEPASVEVRKIRVHLPVGVSIAPSTIRPLLSPPFHGPNIAGSQFNRRIAETIPRRFTSVRLKRPGWCLSTAIVETASGAIPPIRIQAPFPSLKSNEAHRQRSCRINTQGS